MQYLDYDHSLLALTSSVLAHYGVHTDHKPLKMADELLAKQYKNVVIMLFDGMGTSILEKHLPKDSFLRRHYKATISSVFPPTTTAATTTMETGLAPIEHGWLGWSLYFPEVDCNVSIFPNTVTGSGGESAADYNVAGRYIPYKSIYEKITEHTNGTVIAKEVSPFSEYQMKSVNEICKTVIDLCAEEKPTYLYTYWPQPDFDMHEFGTEHEKITEHLRQINQEVESMCKKLKDTLVLITADHGLIDTEWRFMQEQKDFCDCLVRIPSIEARTMSFFVKPEMQSPFVQLFQKYYGEDYVLLTKEEVYDMKLFGTGDPHPRADQFIGDYLAIATGKVSIDNMKHRGDPDIFRAVHAGLTEEELQIPFIAVECD